MRAKIEGSVLEGEILHVKMQNCLKTALSSKQFQLAKGFVVKMQELCVKVQESDEPELPDNNAFLEITLRPI
ncbi:hypothetical protein C2U71_22650 [Burkholderia ubonensis]|nr:hypothetical protein C2U71_22650 [Burkholderia ubonensis]